MIPTCDTIIEKLFFENEYKSYIGDGLRRVPIRRNPWGKYKRFGKGIYSDIRAFLETTIFCRI